MGGAGTLFTLPRSAIVNSTGHFLMRVGQEFLVGQPCGFFVCLQCGANLSAYYGDGSTLWETSTDGGANPASTSYSAFFPTNETALFVGTPSLYLGPPSGGSELGETTFVLLDLNSGQVLDRVVYGYSLTGPPSSAAFLSATPWTSVHAAAVGGRPTPRRGGEWEHGDLNPDMRVSPRAPVTRHGGAGRPSADPMPRGSIDRPDWSPLVCQISLCSHQGPGEPAGRYRLLWTRNRHGPTQGGRFPLRKSLYESAFD